MHTPLSRQQRDMVARSLLLGDTPEERHGVYARRPPLPAPKGTDTTGFAPLGALAFGVTENIFKETG